MILKNLPNVREAGEFTLIINDMYPGLTAMGVDLERLKSL